MFNFIETGIKDLVLIEPTMFNDHRGVLRKHFEKNMFIKNGISFTCFEQLESLSYKNVLRGLHFQKDYPQAKLVRVIIGEIFDVAVDLRISSDTYGKWRGYTLNDENKNMLYIPKGFAHGFLVLSDYAIVSYMCDDQYRPEDECGVVWNDPQLGIKWPINSHKEVIISDKDNKLMSFYEVTSILRGDKNGIL